MENNFNFRFKNEKSENLRTISDNDYEYAKNFQKLKERKYQTIKNLRRIGIAIGTGLILTFAYMKAKGEDVISEEIMKSTSQPTQTEAVISTNTSIPQKISKSEECNLLDNKKYYKPLEKKDVYVCLHDKDISNVTNALLVISEPKNKGKYRSKEFEDSVVNCLYGDSFLHTYALRAIVNQDYTSAVPILIKYFDKISEFAIEEVSYALLHFSLNNDRNAINKLVELSTSQDDTIRIHAMSALLFINKDIMPTFLEQYNKENREIRFEIIKKAEMYRLLYLNDYFSEEKISKFSERLNKRLHRVLKVEKDKEIIELINTLNY